MWRKMSVYIHSTHKRVDENTRMTFYSQQETENGSEETELMLVGHVIMTAWRIIIVLDYIHTTHILFRITFMLYTMYILAFTK